MRSETVYRTVYLQSAHRVVGFFCCCHIPLARCQRLANLRLYYCRSSSGNLIACVCVWSGPDDLVGRSVMAWRLALHAPHTQCVRASKSRLLRVGVCVCVGQADGRRFAYITHTHFAEGGHPGRRRTLTGACVCVNRPRRNYYPSGLDIRVITHTNLHTHTHVFFVHVHVRTGDNRSRN